MKYFSMFSGIGGFEKGIQTVMPTAKCIGFSEIDKYAITTYERNFNGHRNYGDATKIDPNKIPDFDLLVGGFPCQAFSIAGKRKGFDDTRGTLFFDIARILAHKRPRHLVLENVKGLLSHDNGKTFQTILGVLADLGYTVEWQVLNSKDFGVPQNRERVYIVGHFGNECERKIFPINTAYTKTTRKYKTKNIQIREKEGSNEISSNHAICITAQQREASRTVNHIGVVDISNEPSKLNKIIVPKKHRTEASLQDICSTLTSTFKGYPDGEGRPAIIQLNNPKHSNNRVFDTKGLSPTLNTMQGGNRQPFIAPVLSPDRLKKLQSGRRMKNNGEPAFTLTAQDRHGLYDGLRIRRLTPIECERLQGFPDNWTIGSDSQRYKQCGNAVTVNVVQAIMEQLL